MHLVGQAQVNNFAAQSYGQGMFQMSAYLLQTLAREFGQQMRALPPALPAITAPPPAVAPQLPGTPVTIDSPSNISSAVDSESASSSADHGPNPMSDEEEDEEEEEEEDSDPLPAEKGRGKGKQARLCAC